MDFFGILFDMKNGKKVPYSKTYFDTLFAAKLAEMQIKTLTGTLPLNFRTSETALRSWTIYGNNYEHKYSTSGTLPLTFASHTAGAASDWSINGNDSIGKNKLPSAAAETKTVGNLSVTSDGNGGYTINKTGALAEETIVTFDIPELTIPVSQGQGGDGILALFNTKMPTGFQILFYYNGTRLTYISLSTAANRVLTNYSNSLGGQKIDQIAVRMAATESTDIETGVLLPMLTTDNITPSTFEPYQIGVGQRTKNLLEITANTQTISQVTFTVNKEAGTITANGTAGTTVYLNLPINAPSGDYYYSGCALGGSASTYDFYAWDNTISGRPKKWDGETNVDSDYGGTSQEIKVDSEHSMQLTIRIRSGQTVNNLVFKPMLRAADTSADFIPFGYEIPLTVNSTTQDIYIGSAPLTAGQSISKTSTGVDIAAIAGSNTITTSIYNKPSMAIEGVDYVGVGESVNDSWQIPLTVTHYTDNIFDKDAKNANKGYEDSTCIMWAGSIPYPYMTGNIPEDNNCFVSEKIPASPNTTYYLTDGIFKNTDNGIYSVFLWNRFRMSDYQAFPTEKTFTTGDDTKFIQLCVLKSYADAVMITTKPTETYIPHVEVNDVNVPIDAPLTEGQSVTDTLTINTFAGENTIDTTMTNKPNMSITYKGG